MPRIPFDQLPDDARLWVFPASAPLDGPAEETFLARVDAFLHDWRAHGHPLTVGRDWREGRFLFVGVDERSEPPSGCSIDALLGVLKGLEGELGVGLTDHARVPYRTPAGGVVSVTRADFARGVQEGEITPATPVFDTTLTRLDALRRGRFEVPASDAWHRRAFFRDTGAS